MADSVQLNVRTVSAMRLKPPADYQAIRLDSNNTCNLRCVYCHIRRSDELMDLAEFRSFVDEQVLSVREFQIGCIMEPTLDPRLCDFMDVVANSPARPIVIFRLQTNGLLLHRHDHARMVGAGLNVLSVSVDSADARTHGLLRDGASLSKIQRNLVNFHRTCPSVRIKILTTVTTANIGGIEELVGWGVENGIKHFELRQMFHDPTSLVVDHDRMRRLLVADEDFVTMRSLVEARFGGAAKFGFHSADNLVRRVEAIKTASGVPNWRSARAGDRTASHTVSAG